MKTYYEHKTMKSCNNAVVYLALCHLERKMCLDVTKSMIMDFFKKKVEIFDQDKRNHSHTGRS